MASSLFKVAILLAIITLTIARPRNEECGECVSGLPDVPPPAPPVTPPPEDACASGEIDTTTTYNPALTTPAPPC